MFTRNYYVILITTLAMSYVIISALFLYDILNITTSGHPDHDFITFPFHNLLSRGVIWKCSLKLVQCTVYNNLRSTQNYYRGRTGLPANPLREPVPFHSEHYSPVDILVRLILAPHWRKNDLFRLFMISGFSGLGELDSTIF